MNQITLLWLLIVFIACAGGSLLLCGVARTLFPTFRSGEHKPGTHRSDVTPDGREIKTIELPLVGGPAFTIAIVVVGIIAGYMLNFNQDQWILLLIGLGATVGYMLVGFADDWRKVYSKEGLSERTKFAGVFLVSILAALLYFFLLPKSGQESYSPWKDLFFIGDFLCHPATQKSTCQVAMSTWGHGIQSVIPFFGWLIFLMLMTGVTGSLTSLSVDFSDGFDGLAGGLVFSAALAFGIIVIGLIGKSDNGVVLEVLSLLCAGSVLGYLPWNWPSAWAARRNTAKRRAKMYMGDSGALGLGGMLAMIAIFSRQEILLLLVGAAFVLEGLSALVQSRLMTRFFRSRLQVLRFANSKEYVPHTEFPLPFLATPLHHHFDLLGVNRRQLVYGAWALGACFATLGVISNFVEFSWQRYLGRILILLLAWFVWSSGSWSKRYFVGKYPAEGTRRRRLALYYGYPYRLMRINLFHRVELIEANEDVIETPAEELALWQRMTIYDARSMLGLYCYRAGYFPAALAQWTRIPESNRALRPEIARLLNELENRIALEKQETQPIRRDLITRPQKPILSGNLPPADMPNPHEPIRSDELQDGHTDTWGDVQGESYPINTNLDDEERQITASLRKDTVTRTNGHNAFSLNGNEAESYPDKPKQNWLMRILRPSSK